MTDQELEKKLKRYISRDLPHTRKYIIENLEKNPNWIAPKGIMHRDDFISEYYRSRKESGKPTYNYDFSKLPEIIPHRKFKVSIYVNEVSTKTGEIIGEWNTCYKEFIIKLSNNGSIAGMESRSKTEQYVDTEKFIQRSKERFGDLYKYDRVKYISNKHKVELGCPFCNKYFFQMPWEHLSGAGKGCPECAMKLGAAPRALGKEGLIERMDEMYGPGYFDYSEVKYVNMSTKITLIDPDTGERYRTTPEQLLHARYDPKHRNESKGERNVEKWLKSVNLDYIPQYHIPNSSGLGRTKNGTGIWVDFRLVYGGVEYYIEFDGAPHFMYGLYRFKDIVNPIDRFLRQIKRDLNLEEYCKVNSIKLLRVPFTYNTYDKVAKVLNQKIILKEEIIIKLPEIKFPEGYSMEDVKKLIEEESVL